MADVLLRVLLCILQVIHDWCLFFDNNCYAYATATECFLSAADLA